MRSITIRNVPEEVHRALRVRAVQRGRLTAAEVNRMQRLRDKAAAEPVDFE